MWLLVLNAWASPPTTAELEQEARAAMSAYQASPSAKTAHEAAMGTWWWARSAPGPESLAMMARGATVSLLFEEDQEMFASRLGFLERSAKQLRRAPDGHQILCDLSGALKLRGYQNNALRFNSLAEKGGGSCATIDVTALAPGSVFDPARQGASGPTQPLLQIEAPWHPEDEAWVAHLRLTHADPVGPLFLEVYQKISSHTALVARLEIEDDNDEPGSFAEVLLLPESGFNAEKAYTMRVVQIREDAAEETLAETTVTLKR